MARRLTIRSLIDRALWPVLERLDRIEATMAAAEQRLERVQTATGRLEARQLGLEASDAGPLAEHEFRVFSQWGEDGIIQWLFRTIDSSHKVFVEFGVGDYLEANTRFLLDRDNWSGLVIDSSVESIERLRRSEICWRHGLRAAHAFITRDNINSLIQDNGISGEIGLLSIDIDGNDYWVWEAIEVVTPDLVVIEYNHRFGKELAVTIPYDESFCRGEKYPLIYFGASLRALCVLANRKGYVFIGCNSNGVNAFFVRRDKLGDGAREISPAQGFVPGKFSDMRDERGLFVPASPQDEYSSLMELPLVTISD